MIHYLYQGLVIQFTELTNIKEGLDHIASQPQMN